MNIVVLDRETLGYDLDVSVFDKFSDSGNNVRIYDLTSEREVFERIQNADIIITCKVLLGQKELSSAMNLKMISLLSTGTNNVDMAYCRKHGIAIQNVRGYSTDSVVQHIWALILSLTSHLNQYNKIIHNGEWQKSSSFTVNTYPVDELNGKVLGIIGYGAIGRKVTEIGSAFGMKKAALSLRAVDYQEDFRLSHDEFFQTSDVIVVCSALTDETRDLIGDREFNMMKKDTLFINCSRGAIVDENALYEALIGQRIAGAGIDVLREEPPADGNKLLELDIPNLIITPHVAWSSLRARKILLNKTIINVDNFIHDRSITNLTE